MQRQLVASLCVFLLLLGWSLLPEPYGGWALLPLWIACTALICAGGLEAARLRRRVWLDQYLLPSSPWHRLLRGGALMVARHLLLGAVLGLFLLLKLRLLHFALWAVLALGLLLVAWLLRWLSLRMHAHLLPRTVLPLARRFTVPLAVCVLTTFYLVVMLSLGQPDMRGLNWEAAVAQPMPQSSGQFAALLFIERLYWVLDVTLQWALQNTLGGAGPRGALALVGWSLLLLSGSAFIWAYVRLMVGISALLDRWEAV